MPETTRLLIVDDEKRILETFSNMLDESGYYVKTASTALDALNLVSDEDFDIVFLDQYIGKEKGLDLMQKMDDLNHGLYYVLITAHGSPDLAVEAMKKGASDFISKPFFVTDMIKSIEYVNKKRDLDRQKKQILTTLETRINEKTEELKQIYFPVLSSLAQAMEKKDMGTYGHSMRVRRNSLLIAAALDLREEEREDLQVAAMLHDIGKIGTSDFILGKKGPLDEEEMLVIRAHPKKGVEILSPLRYAFKQLENILPAILYHHENYDGSGYPAGLSGDNIPLLARIITVADTYDAILSNRPYRAAADHRKAFEELLFCSGRQFDKRIVDAFVNAEARYSRLFTVTQ